MRPAVGYGLAAAALTALALARIVATYPAVSQTIDEKSHVATGLEWLERGEYTLNQEDPPLPRVAVAFGPWLSGARLRDGPHGQAQVFADAPAGYPRTLHLARLGTLPFFAFAAAMVWLWARRLFGDATALAALALFSALPAVLAHAGLATTDLAITAALPAALFAFVLWLERPDRRRGLALGAALALAVGTKFTAALFLAAGGAAILATRWLCARAGRAAAAAPPDPPPLDWPALARGALGVAAVALLGLWATYQFSIGPVRGPEHRPYRLIDRHLAPDGALHRLAVGAIEAPIPMPEFLGGVGEMIAHAGKRRPTYLLGEVRDGGFAAFFPVAFAVKTPLAFLALLAVGAFALVRGAREPGAWRRLAPLAGGLAGLASLVPTGVNVGFRHALPVLPMLAIVAGVGATTLWNARAAPLAARGALAALAAWLVVDSAAAHPDYLPYFNEIARARPAHFLSDSDLDWGQDVGRLADELRRRDTGPVKLGLFTSALARHEWPEGSTPLRPGERPAGWVAASEFRIRVTREFAWLDAHEPVARIGHSIRLYSLPAPSPSSGRASDAGMRVKR